MNEQLLLSVVENINTIKGRYPGKKELQKTVYLLQKKGLSSDYSYRFYFYGPYSDSLDEDIQRLTIKGSLKIREDENTHRIELTERALKSLNEEGCVALVQDTIRDLSDIPPVHLELMTTIIFLQDKHMVSENPSETEVIKKVHEVKNDKYPDDEIRRFYQLLKEKKYIH